MLPPPAAIYHVCAGACVQHTCTHVGFSHTRLETLENSFSAAASAVAWNDLPSCVCMAWRFSEDAETTVGGASYTWMHKLERHAGMGEEEWEQCWCWCWYLGTASRRLFLEDAYLQVQNVIRSGRKAIVIPAGRTASTVYGPLERMQAVQACKFVLNKQRFTQVMPRHALAAAKHMINFIKKPLTRAIASGRTA